MSAEVTFLPQSTNLPSLSNPTPTNTLPPFDALQSPSLSLLPYLSDDTWLNLTNLISKPPTTPLPVTQKPSPTLHPSQIHKQRKTNSPSLQKDQKPTQHQKRELFLARNRRAATKCRAKKRESTQKLQDEYEAGARRKRALEGDIAELQKEVLELKNELLRHSRCVDPAVQHHLAGMVRRVTIANPTFPELWDAAADSGFEGLGSGSGSGSVSSGSVSSGSAGEADWYGMLSGQEVCGG